MGKKGDPKVPILPSRTRKYTFDDASTTFELLVHLVLLLKNRLLLLPDSRELKLLLPKPLLEKLMILPALRRDSLRMIILYLMMIYAGSLMNVLIPTLLL